MSPKIGAPPLSHESGPQALTPAGHPTTDSPAATVASPGDVPGFLALSDERDHWHELMLAAWRDGYTAGLAELEQAEGRGYARAVSDFKACQHATVTGLRQHLATWDGLRTRFADPRPDDYRGEVA